MKREILFRGKHHITGGWLYGDLVHCTSIVFGVKSTSTGIQNELEPEFVDPSTVGQFTGLMDKNGVKIFEGDVYHMGDPSIKYVVIWKDGGFAGKQIGSSSFAGLSHWIEQIEVIGNIHDSPKLFS